MIFGCLYLLTTVYISIYKNRFLLCRIVDFVVSFSIKLSSVINYVVVLFIFNAILVDVLFSLRTMLIGVLFVHKFLTSAVSRTYIKNTKLFLGYCQSVPNFQPTC